jgi:hypothetical protein
MGQTVKSPYQILNELLSATRPPPGVIIIITERTNEEPNWVAAAPGGMPLEALSRYRDAHLELRRSDPEIDWTSVSKPSSGHRHISKAFSEES